MTRVRALALFTLLALAVGACTAASALAAPPEFVGPPSPFTGTSGLTTLETVKGAKITCTKDTLAGETTGPKSGTMTKITLSGCELVTLALPCNTVGVPPGEVVVGPLQMTLGYINAEKKEDGIDLTGPNTGGIFTEFDCGALKVVVEGSVIGKVTPVNKLLKPPAHFTLKFTQAAGKQKPTKLAGEPTDVLFTSFGGPFVESGLASADTMAFPIPLMISA